MTEVVIFHEPPPTFCFLESVFITIDKGSAGVLIQ